MRFAILFLIGIPVFSIFLSSCGIGFFESRYVYDNQNRLEREEYKSVSEHKELRFIYDNNGNIIEVRTN
ncbi:hypothetical protein [Phorcysia thermohydrogeniphila]|uniref:YD repeat-containing protein n=1 Tax=Phorcysia thermohydrogeniphila TaxID=936138 RepID=A0A4R1GLN5_9BACT|nr:hypothetical protein [Phorcysia thermohydrogeniphila]TCK05302.1 hypothetical protein CLV27_0729 [Phorcysia thermohydrogeniphila]